MSARYTVLIDGEPKAYGVAFPDLPGCVAMGDTLEDALSDATEVLREWVEATEASGAAIPAARSPDQLLADKGVRAALKEGAVFGSAVLIGNAG